MTVMNAPVDMYSDQKPPPRPPMDEIRIFGDLKPLGHLTKQGTSS
jgi:hypothetical protein